MTPLTFREISQNPVITDMWEEPKTWNIEHIRLAEWADLLLVAPATANFIGKAANGIADDMLTTVVMAAKARIIFVPAMNSNMYLNPILQRNLKILQEAGYIMLEPAYGLMACGIEGPGRLPEPAVIAAKISEIFNTATQLAGKKVIVTAGGTREAIDPVRYIGNHSSGKMGYAIAKAAAARGAAVTLVSGRTNLAEPAGMTVQTVETAREMREAVLAGYASADIVIKAAAVADYRPAETAANKIKKTAAELTICLTKNPDILKELGQLKQQQILVGFAAETEDLIVNAGKKLAAKNLDMIVANDVTAAGAGFNLDTNVAKLLFRDGSIQELPLMSKEELAGIILDKVIGFMAKKA